MTTKTRLDDYAIKLVKGPIFIIILLNGATRSLAYLTGKYPGILPPSVELGSDALTSVAVVLIVATVANLVLNELLNKKLRKIVSETPDKETSFRLVSRLTSYIIYLIGIVVILSILFPGGPQALMGALVGAGFLAIVIGMAAQKVIGNFLSSISINVTRPIRIGDNVMIKGEYGSIEDITFRHTVIRTWDNRRLIIPNSVLDDEIIINYSLKDPRMLLPVTVQISYESDVEKALMLLKEIAKNHPNCLPDMEPVTQVLSFDENGVTLRLLLMAKDQPTAFQTGCDIRREIIKRFPKEGIDIPYPRRYLIFGEDKLGVKQFKSCQP
ncbi:MAG: mechanosensitive ion channel family protein [Candidatus Bathyarchaeia archaeon]